LSIYRTLRILVAATLLLGAAPSGPRIVTLIPSLAEDAFAVGANVIAVSKFTDDMTQAKGLPIIADFQSVDSEAIIRLHPDVVVGIPSQARLVEPLRRARIRVELIPDDTFDDIFLDISKLGELSNHLAQERQACGETAVGVFRIRNGADLDRRLRLLHWDAR